MYYNLGALWLLSGIVSVARKGKSYVSGVLSDKLLLHISNGSPYDAAFTGYNSFT